MKRFERMVFGAEPFTIAFAKRWTPEAFWGTDLFITINLVSNQKWLSFPHF